MDALSDVLKSVRLEGAVYLNAEFTAPWCVQAKYGLASVRQRLAGAEHVVFFHFVTEGGFKVHVADGVEGPAAALLRELLRVGVRESSASRPGAESMLAKLSELMFVEAMRRYVEMLPPQGKGWLAGVRDAHVGRALALLHVEPGKAWTVDGLAHEVALSRSALAERFAALVGEPPIQYLLRW